MTSLTAPRWVSVLAALALLSAGALVGCSDQDSAPTPAPASSSAGPSNATPSDSTSAVNKALTAAGQLALAAADESGTIISIEQETGGSSWEVLVAASDGSEQEIHTNQDGTTVTSGPVSKRTDPDDKRENQQFIDAADLSYDQAASRLTDITPGTITEIGLDDHAGSIVWEGDVIDASNSKHSIRIDAGSGKTVTNTVDTDD